MNLAIFVPPLVGAVIGYITNDIAIKMLFHPRKPIYIGKWQMPFTPGLIPKEKHRVAKSIGRVVSEQLLNADTLTAALASEEMTQKLHTALERLIERNRSNESTLEQVLGGFIPEQTMNVTMEKVKQDVSAMLYEKLCQAHFGEAVAEHVLQKAGQTIGGPLRGLGLEIVSENMFSGLAGGIGGMIDKAIAEHAQEPIQNLIDTEAEDLMGLRVCDLLEKYEEKLPGLVNFAVQTYIKIVNTNLEQILKSVEIERIVEEKIASFDVAQLEAMIFGIMNKELKAIVYLGALLGFLMGWVNLLIGI